MSRWPEGYKRSERLAFTLDANMAEDLNNIMHRAEKLGLPVHKAAIIRTGVEKAITWYQNYFDELENNVG